MGIVNVTPDSFSDGGECLAPADAVVRICQMAAEGAHLIDIGGESTRPGSVPVPPDIQIQRIVPVIKQARIHGVGLPLSIDTQSAAVAAAALDAGGDIVNDISAARSDPAMLHLLAERRVPFILMHMQGTPHIMQDAPSYCDVVQEVSDFFVERLQTLAAAGVDTRNVIVDPGIGFGKMLEHNLALLRAIPIFAARWPVLIGPSRKRFIGQILNEPDARSRLMGTAAVVAHCALSGADIVRVHDIKEMKQVVKMCKDLRSPR